MVKRFTVDFARMKINAAKIEKDIIDSQLDFVVAPKSIRPLPVDIETDLRKACALIVSTSSAPEDEYPTGRREKRATTLLNPTRPADFRRPGLDSHPIYNKVLPDFPPREQSLAGRRSHDAATYYRTQAALEASARVGHVMAVPQADDKPQHGRSKSSSAYLNVAIPKFNRPNTAMRGSSIETTHSAYQSDATEEHVISTAITSLAITPARMSKRGSAQAVQVTEKIAYRPDSQDLEEMMRKLNAHRETREEEHTKQNVILRRLAMPTRKPVRPTKHNEGSMESFFNSQTVQPAMMPDVSNELWQSMDKQADTERRGRSTIRARAASSARSLSRGVKEFLRPGSRHSHDIPTRPAIQSRNQETTAPVHDWSRRGFRASVDSLIPTLARSNTDEAQPAHAARKKFSQMTMSDLRRPASSGVIRTPGAMSSSVGLRQTDQEGIDLNRQLPPLPTLDSWAGYANDSLLAEVLSSQTPYVDDTSSSRADTGYTQYARPLAHAHDDECPVSPITDTQMMSAFSPWPEMSATFCPGGFDMYGPMRTPSPMSESSIIARRLSNHDVIDTSAAQLDDEEELPPDSPLVAQLVSRISSGNLRAQLVDTRSSSRGPSRPTTSRSLNVPTLDLSAIPHLPSPITKMPTPVQVHLPMSSEHDGRIFGETMATDPANARPVILIRKKTKKHWWQATAKAKPHDWMKDVEQSGSRSGVIMIDEVAAAPIVRYS